jgi:arylsulfatase A-like enzyme
MSYLPVRIRVLSLALFFMSGCTNSLPRDNVLFISIDTLRADRLGCYGYPSGSTPFLDRLAERGIVVRDTIATIPHTTPSHASILTGLFPMHHGSRDNALPVKPNMATLAGYLAREGYATGGFAAHFLLSPECSGLNQGFQTYSAPSKPGYMNAPNESGAFGIISNDSLPAGKVSETALKWLKTAPEPFFAFIHYYDCHRPHEAVSPFTEFAVPSVYDKEVALVDRAVDQIVIAILKRDLTRGLRIHVVSDHGESLGEHGLTGHGRFLYYPSVVIPWISSAYPQNTKGHISDILASTTDILPTLLSQLAIPIPETIDGIDQTGMEPNDETLRYSESATGWQNETGKRIRSVRNRRYTFIYGPETGISELYDRSMDPAETRDVGFVNAQVRTGFERFLNKWINQDTDTPANPVDVLDKPVIESLKALGYIPDEDD